MNLRLQLDSASGHRTRQDRNQEHRTGDAVTRHQSSLRRHMWAAVLVLTTPFSVAAQSPAVPDAKTGAPQAIAAALLDASIDQKARETLAHEASPRATAVVEALVAGLPANDEAEEYRRIPWIWRVAVAAGRANDEAALKPLLVFSMPRENERFRDWQAVVLGGGIVMGLSQAGRWPKDAMAPWLAEDPVRARRWSRVLGLAEAMAEDG